ncbi:MAG: hypothetical protein M0R00_02795 [Candidatus Omnitrophica bacterium]|jgi:hypothetical protein|nr:hypothetical protein [Candidatus Omnitrophota bacterium]
MAITVTLSNHWRYQLGKKMVDVSADTFKIILMDDTFAFDKDAHATLNDVISSPSHELPTNYGYTQQNKALSGGSWAEDDTEDKGIRTFDNVTWTAYGGNIGPTGCAIIYDDTTADKTVVGCIDYGTDYTIPDGASFQIQAPKISV